MNDIFQEKRENYFSHIWLKHSHDIYQERNISHMFEVVEECSATETFVAEERETASLKQI